MEEYCKDLQAVSEGKSRAGKKVLIVKALSVRESMNSFNLVNVVVTPEDADRIILAAQKNKQIYANGAVVFVR